MRVRNQAASAALERPEARPPEVWSDDEKQGSSRVRAGAERGCAVTFRVSIQIGNEAMSEPFHVAAALERVARALEGGELEAGWSLVHDGNGNRVGWFEVVE